MDIKILTSITTLADEGRSKFVIGTHGGIGHSDETVAVGILCLLHEGKEICIIRTRDMEELSKCDICVDVGGGEFDHHQKGFDICREDGVLYASAGLIWKEFGEELIAKLLAKHFSEILDGGYQLQNIPHEVWKIIDADVMSLVDAEDNGISVENHCFSYISSFLPLWFNTNFDEQFLKVLKVTIDMLEQRILHTAQSCIAEIILTQSWHRRGTIEELTEGKCTFAGNILSISSQTIPWVEKVIEFNKSIFTPFLKEDSINFVIFPYPAGGWAAQCVPPSIEKKFDKRIPFPKEWAGQTDKLPEVSGVDDATFCHNGCFFVRAKTKKSVIEMCKLAME